MPQSNKKGPEGTNFRKLMLTEIKKALCKHQHKDRKCHTSVNRTGIATPTTVPEGWVG